MFERLALSYYYWSLKAFYESLGNCKMGVFHVLVVSLTCFLIGKQKQQVAGTGEARGVFSCTNCFLELLFLFQYTKYVHFPELINIFDDFPSSSRERGMIIFRFIFIFEVVS